MGRLAVIFFDRNVFDRKVGRQKVFTNPIIMVSFSHGGDNNAKNYSYQRT